MEKKLCRWEVLRSANVDDGRCQDQKLLEYLATDKVVERWDTLSASIKIDTNGCSGIDVP